MSRTGYTASEIIIGRVFSSVSSDSMIIILSVHVIVSHSTVELWFKKKDFGSDQNLS